MQQSSSFEASKKLENRICDVFRLNDMDDLRDLSNRLIKPGGRGHLFCSAFQFSSSWRGLQSLRDYKDIANDGKA